MSSHRSKQIHRIAEARILRLGSSVKSTRQAGLILAATKKEYNAIPRPQRHAFISANPEAIPPKMYGHGDGRHYNFPWPDLGLHKEYRHV